MDDCETHNSSQPFEEQNYDNEEFYPEEEEIPEGQDRTQGRVEGYYNIDPEEQTNLENTILHKAMIGIGPYLVQKAASVLGASRSYSGDLSYLPKALGQRTVTSNHHRQTEEQELERRVKNELQRKRHSPEDKSRRHGLTNSVSQNSFTKGFQKLMISGGQERNSQTRSVQSRGSAHHFKFQRGGHNNGNNKRANNKCSSTSSLGRRVPGTTKIQPDSSIGQRLTSARRMQIKELKSRITQLEKLLKESRKETQTLTRMQRRHEIALMKYEGTEAELPKLIRSHVAEVRSLQENLRKVQSHNRSVDEKLKMRDLKIFRLEEESKTLILLVKQNNLEERSKLAEQLEQARMDNKQMEVKVSELQRHVEILDKNYLHQINVETRKLKVTNNKLFEAHQEIDKLVMTLKEKDRNLTYLRIRQGQIPTGTVGASGGGGVPSFRDDLSIRSARTLPMNKPTRMTHQRPADQTSLDERVRRQRSETCSHNRKPVRTKLTNYYDYEEEDPEQQQQQSSPDCQQHGHVDTPYPKINQNQCINYTQQHQHHQQQQQQQRNPHSRSPPPSFRQVRHSHIESVSTMTPTSHRSNQLTGRTSHSSPHQQRQILTDSSVQGGTPGNDDEYFNFENVSVEEEEDYRPHKNLFMDAMDSSCNVSLVSQSPLDSMRSRDNSNNNQLHFAASKNLRPSSAGPKFRLPLKRQKEGSGGVTFGSPQRDDMISSIACPSALQSPSIDGYEENLGDEHMSMTCQVKVKNSTLLNSNQGAGAGDGPSQISPQEEEAEPGFISQRLSNEQISQMEGQEEEMMTPTNQQQQNPMIERCRSLSPSSSSSGDSEDEQQGGGEVQSGYSTSPCDTEVGILLSPNSPMKSEVHGSSPRDQNIPVIEAMFTKWKKDRRIPFESNNNLQDDSESHNGDSVTSQGQNGSQQQQPETTPRRKEALLQKIKEIDASRKKTDEKVSLSIPAYFSKLDGKILESHEVKPSSQLFKPSLYQPFFNTTPTTTTGNQGSQDGNTPVQFEVKNCPLPWLNVNSDTTSSSTDSHNNNRVGGQQDTEEGDKSGLRIQHSSFLEPRHTLVPFSSSLKTSPWKSGEEGGGVESTLLEHNDNHDFESTKDAPRKKFTIGTISSLQASSSLTCAKKGIGIVRSKQGVSPSWK